MIEIVGNLWDYHTKGHWVCILTNGQVNREGYAIMGRGCAAEAAKRYPLLSGTLGINLKTVGNGLFVCNGEAVTRIIIFPTKKRWKDKSDITLIIESAITLMGALDTNQVPTDKPVILPRPGCGNGGLYWETEVKPLLIPILDDRVHVIHNPVDTIRLVK